MIILFTKLLALISPQILCITLAKLLTPTTWRTVIVGSAATALYLIIRTPIRMIAREFPEIQMQALMGEVITVHFVLLWLAYSVTKQAMLWSIFRHPKSPVKTWQDTLVFAFSYSATAAIITLPTRFRKVILHIAHDFETISTSEYTSLYGQIVSLKTIPTRILEDRLNQDIPWRSIFSLMPEYSFLPLAISLATALGVLYSIHTKKIWPIIAATFLHILTAPVYSFGLGMWVWEEMRKEGVVGQIASTIFDLTFWINGNTIPFLIIHHLPGLLLFIPTIAFAIYIIRQMNRPAGATE